MENIVPSIVTPPDNPFSMGLKFKIDKGLDLLNTPISEAQVSAVDTAKDTP